MPAPMLVTFAAGSTGAWKIDQIASVVGAGLPAADRLAMIEGAIPSSAPAILSAKWALRGVTSNLRYTHHTERAGMEAIQEGLARPTATRAALIPIRKNEAWWNLAQDQRRAIFEETSRHIAIGKAYLPAIARRLHHCRDLGGEPFDFLTWFEYAPQDAEAFERLVRELRVTQEWRYVEREVDVRLSR
jgi:chlorite dismutase